MYNHRATQATGILELTPNMAGVLWANAITERMPQYPVNRQSKKLRHVVAGMPDITQISIQYKQTAIGLNARRHGIKLIL